MMNMFNPISGFAQALPWSSSAMKYLIDRTQRTTLFWDVLRKRGNNYLTHLRAGQPPVLVFDYEMVLDGRTFEQPVNYSLIRILDRRSKEDKPARQTDRRLSRPAADHYKVMIKEQARVLELNEKLALEGLAHLLPTQKDRIEAFTIAKQIASADEKLDKREQAMLDRISKILELDEVDS
jgi:hypothetical protein